MQSCIFNFENRRQWKEDGGNEKGKHVKIHVKYLRVSIILPYIRQLVILC